MSKETPSSTPRQPLNAQAIQVPKESDKSQVSK